MTYHNQQARQRIRIAVQKKGRLYTESMNLFNQIGIKVSMADHHLYCGSTNFPIDFLFVRDDDIPTLVNDGVCDLGVIGENVLYEFEKHCHKESTSFAIHTVKQLGYAGCRLAIAVPENWHNTDIQALQGTKIATSYPALLQSFLTEHDIRAEILTISGSVEVAPSLGMADAICDLVSTGRTLEENHLKPIMDVLHSEAVLIKSNQVLNSSLKAVYDSLLTRIEGAQMAQHRKYVMFHAPRNALETIEKMLPGNEGLTIMNIAGNDEKVAVHIMTKEAVFWNTLEMLKSAGASSILVLPIEKMLD